MPRNVTSSENSLIIYFNSEFSNTIEELPNYIFSTYSNNTNKHDKNCPMILAMDYEYDIFDSDDEENGTKEEKTKHIYAHNKHIDTLEKIDIGYYITNFCNRCHKSELIICGTSTLDPEHKPCQKCNTDDWVSSERFLCCDCIENTIYPLNRLSWNKRLKVINDYYHQESSNKKH
jgi:hypothetical protein